MHRVFRLGLWVLLALAVPVFAYTVLTRLDLDPRYEHGDVVDRFNGVAVYYNGGVNQVSGRHRAPDGYNLGLSWQCVEFVKRYYYERFGHRMPETRGHARSFFAPDLPDGALNPARGLLQFRNGGGTLPQADDILVFGPGLFNPYGHVAIAVSLNAQGLTLVQQNPGPWAASRETLPLELGAGVRRVGEARLLGWLRRPPPSGLSASRAPHPLH